jgi:hypothetical protein
MLRGPPMVRGTTGAIKIFEKINKSTQTNSTELPVRSWEKLSMVKTSLFSSSSVQYRC